MLTICGVNCAKIKILTEGTSVCFAEMVAVPAATVIGESTCRRVRHILDDGGSPGDRVTETDGAILIRSTSDAADLPGEFQ